MYYPSVKLEGKSNFTGGTSSAGEYLLCVLLIFLQEKQSARRVQRKNNQIYVQSKEYIILKTNVKIWKYQSINSQKDSVKSKCVESG